MGYLFLAIAVITGVMRGYCGKKTSGYVAGYKGAMLASMIRMIFCTIIGLALTALSEGITVLRVDSTTLWIALLSGVGSAVFIVGWMVAVRTGAYMMLDVFQTLGILVPILGSWILFDEMIRIPQWIGLAILTAAVYIMCSYNNSIKEKIGVSSLLILILCGVSYGVMDFSQKLFVESGSSASIMVFNFYTYLFAALVLLAVYGIVSIGGKQRQEKVEIKPVIGYVFAMAVCMFAYSFFKTKAAGYLPSTQLYPLAQGANMILASIMLSVCFNEKMTGKGAAGLVLAFVGLVIINLL